MSRKLKYEAISLFDDIKNDVIDNDNTDNEKINNANFLELKIANKHGAICSRCNQKFKSEAILNMHLIRCNNTNNNIRFKPSSLGAPKHNFSSN